MHTKGIDIFNKAYGNHIAFGITHNLQFQLFPAENRFLYQNLTNEGSLQTACAYGFSSSTL